ncbi:MAG: helix-turn-helix domain-containing protein [Candidatus Synoicihabitans palmerolidicus]|nr:helix-turn-helix domain-containing protein [Candidatus Synoicihabitans palmerolidicus]
MGAWPAPVNPLIIEAAQHQELEQMIKRPTTPQREVRRARIVLLRAEGKSQEPVAAQIGVNRPVVAKGEKRFREAGLAGWAKRDVRAGSRVWMWRFAFRSSLRSRNPRPGAPAGPSRPWCCVATRKASARRLSAPSRACLGYRAHQNRHPRLHPPRHGHAIRRPRLSGRQNHATHRLSAYPPRMARFPQAHRCVGTRRLGPASDHRQLRHPQARQSEELDKVAQAAPCQSPWRRAHRTALQHPLPG